MQLSHAVLLLVCLATPVSGAVSEADCTAATCHWQEDKCKPTETAMGAAMGVDMQASMLALVAPIMTCALAVEADCTGDCAMDGEGAARACSLSEAATITALGAEAGGIMATMIKAQNACEALEEDACAADTNCVRSGRDCELSEASGMALMMGNPADAKRMQDAVAVCDPSEAADMCPLTSCGTETTACMTDSVVGAANCKTLADAAEDGNPTKALAANALGKPFVDCLCTKCGVKSEFCPALSPASVPAVSALAAATATATALLVAALGGQ